MLAGACTQAPVWQGGPCQILAAHARRSLPGLAPSESGTSRLHRSPGAPLGIRRTDAEAANSGGARSAEPHSPPPQQIGQSSAFRVRAGAGSGGILPALLVSDTTRSTMARRSDLA